MGSLDESSKFVSLKLSLLGNNLKNPRTVKGSQKKGRHPHGAINNAHNKLGPFLLYVSLLAKQKQPGCWWLLVVIHYRGGKGLWTIAHKAGVRTGLCYYLRQVAGVGKATGSSSNDGAEPRC